MIVHKRTFKGVCFQVPILNLHSCLYCRIAYNALNLCSTANSLKQIEYLLNASLANEDFTKLINTPTFEKKLDPKLLCIALLCF